MIDNPDLRLLETCAARMGTDHLDDADALALRAWWNRQRDKAAGVTELFMERPVGDWTGLILAHRSHRHPWYAFLGEEATEREFAGFMLENRGFPAFLPMVERALRDQVCDEARAALQRNIDDEQLPVPHADLMRRLMGAMRSRVGDQLHLDEHESRIDRTLACHYGYHLDVWSMIGSLYVTEVLALDRLQAMDKGLRRLGFGEDDMEFVRVHLGCDEDHAREWSDCVIAPTLAIDPHLRSRIAEGIAVSLETSALYLDHLVRRVSACRDATRRDRADGALLSQPA